VSERRFLALGLAAALLIVAVVQWPVLECQARYEDDNLTVTENPLVLHPGWVSVSRFVREWRVPSSVPGYYQPVTMISLMLDAAVGGSRDDFTAFHRTNLALHLLNVLLAGLVVFAVFGNAVAAVLATLLFGLHPVAVEPLAWLSERKTLLATFFAWLAVWLYLVNAGHRVRRIVLPLAAYGLALLSKPSVVPVPLMLLVLDVWPLRRVGWPALVEKWPFFLVALVSSVVSTISQRSAHVTPIANLGLTRLLLESVYLVGYYERLAFFPTDLTPLVPPPDPLTFATPDVLLGFFGTLVVAFGLWRVRRRIPAGLTGVALYFLALAPSFTILTWSSFIAYGRYLYFPALGLLVAACGLFVAAWTTRSVVARRGRFLLALAFVAIVAAEARASREALEPWRDSVRLWRHVARLAPNEPAAHNGYGVALETHGDLDAAAAEYRRAIEITPIYFFSWLNLGALERQRGRLDESIRVLSRLVSFSRGSYDALESLGTSELEAGRLRDAERDLMAADSLRPGQLATLDQLGLAMSKQGEAESAVQFLRKAVELHPDDARSRLLLGTVLIQAQGIRRETLELLDQAIHLAPEWQKPRIALAWLLATAPDRDLRDPERARALAADAVARTHRNDASALDALGAASAALGDFPKAIDAATAAKRLAQASHEDSLAREIEARAQSYRRGLPYVQRLKK